MRIYFSNKDLWETISKILISAAVLFLFSALFFHSNIFLVILFVMSSFLLTFGTFRIVKQSQKLYIEIKKNMIIVNDFWKEDKKTVIFADIKSLTKNGSNIIVSTENDSDIFIKLEYLNAEDSKKLINLLKYQPAIKKKNFFA